MRKRKPPGRMMNVAFPPNKTSMASLLVSLASLTLAACATQARPSSPPADIAGFWHGTTRSTCESIIGPAFGRCSAINDVTFAVEQNEQNFRGIFTCRYGNYNCRHMMESGNIVAGEINGRRVMLRVVMPDDGSSCIYSGMLASSENAKIDGGFTCIQGGSLVDKGNWHIEKAR